MTHIHSGQSRGWVPDTATFARRLTLVRYQMGWYNVDHAARECGIPKETWRTWEKGVTATPRDLPAVAAAISRRTGVDAGWLMTGEPPDARAA